MVTFIKKENWFVDVDSSKKEISFYNGNKKHKTSMKNNYCAYASDKDSEHYTFLDQYWKFDNITSYDEICENIQHQMELALEILENHKE